MSKTTSVAVMVAALIGHPGLPVHAGWLPPPKDSKVSADLMELASDPTVALRSTATSGGEVVIDTAASGEPEILASDLRALGARKVTVFGRMVSAIMPSESIQSLNKLSSLQLARPAPRTTMVGDVTSQGDVAMRSDISRTAFGVDGTGVMVGTLSDSYNCLGNASDGIASGDLPAGTIVIEEGPCILSDRDEGRAMIEIIHDVAPGARHSFHTAHYGQANFAQGILALAGVGANVINDDITYLFEPFYQDGIIAQAIDLVKARGVTYFSAAGNDARQAYEAPFRPSGSFFDIGKGPSEAHDFDPGPGVDTCQQYTLPQGERVTFVYQWDQPFFSVSGPPGSANDMDIIISTPDCDFDLMTSGSVEHNISRDPLEWFQQADLVNNKFGMMLLHTSGPAPGLMKVVVTGTGPTTFTFDEFATRTGASWGHSAARGGLGVGAAPWYRTPVFGVDPPIIENFSSAGGSPILFDTSGNRLSTPEVRRQPDITAPDGVDTISFGVFFGTSAAAPHAAGVAALMKDLVPTLAPDAMYTALKETAIDMDDPSTAGFDTGFDFGTGFGLIQADAALNEVAPEPAPIPPVIPPTEPPEPPVAPPEPVRPVPPDVPEIPPGAPPVAPQPPFPPAQPVAPVVPRTDLCKGLTATIVGTEGRDIIIGTSGPDVIHGLGGNDVIRGIGGNDVICGGAGRDLIFGGRGRDKLFGEAGRDRLNGGPGRDRCRGGSGVDTFLRCE